MNALSTTLGVSERTVGAAVAAAGYSALVERRGLTSSAIEGAVMGASDAIGQTFAYMIPFGSSSSFDLQGALSTGIIYSVGTRLVGYQGPFNSYLGNALYGVGCDLVGQGLTRGTLAVAASSASVGTHHSGHRNHSGV